MTRLFWLVLGLGSFLLALAGVVLPLLPTTPFLLVSAYAFARSSPRLHGWLVQHPQLGPPIQNWHHEGAIGRNTKIAAVLAMVATLIISLVVGVGSTVLVIQALVLATAAAFVVSRPTATPTLQGGLEKESRKK